MTSLSPWSTEVRRTYLLVGDYYVRADLIESWTQRREADGSLTLVVTTHTGGSYESPGESMAAFGDRMKNAPA